MTLLGIVRVAFVVLFSTVLLLNIISINPNTAPAAGKGRVLAWPVVLAVGLGLAAVVVAVDLFTSRKKISTLFAVFIGLMAAVIGSIAIGAIIDLLAESYQIDDPSLMPLIKVLLGIGMAYLSVSTVLQTKDDFRLVIPYVEFVRQVRGTRPMLLDTSVLIDGRILELSNTGLISAPLVVPRFVVEELQTLADSQDRLKRARGRRGLSMIEKLQQTAAIDVHIDETQIAQLPTDQRLLELARTMPAIIVTTDSGLARVGDIQKIAVLNLHDVAAAMRPTTVAGEAIRVKVIRHGEQPGQGVAYLDDGTMVVIESGGEFQGQDIEVLVTSTLQTASGRLVFAKLPGALGGAKSYGKIPEPEAAGTQAAEASQERATGASEQPHAQAEEGDDPTQDGAEGQSGQSSHPRPPGSGTPPGTGGGSGSGSGPGPVKPPRSLRNGSPRNPRR